ncbi:rho GTPase-activating protein 23 isoform X3 [Pseudopipra pipra]|uniref:rho GTPase-activating protein 23 isoform X3 n=1 Tax=Pseudopipra pipra TaxID=415032 RepID=UPI003138DDB8
MTPLPGCAGRRRAWAAAERGGGSGAAPAPPPAPGPPPAPAHGPRPDRRARALSGPMEQPPPGRRDGASPNANVPPEGGSFPWVGPKTVVLRKSSQGGFGFTLRHFIVYPPESAVHSAKEEENGNRAGPPRSRLEPMDTIFVKNVREDGPAHQAGLRTGDRLVKVNGESIIGKTYSQVIALIQNSDDVLELSIMPKDEDILQLAYSQDAYLKGNEPYSGGAQSIPEPPPICYPRKTYPFQARGAEPPPGQPPDPRAHRPSATGPSATGPRSDAGGSPAHRPEDPQPGGPPPRPHGHPGSFSRPGCPGSAASSVPDRYGMSPPAAASCHTAPKHLPEHRTHCGFQEAVGGLSGAGRPPRDVAQRAPGRQECQQALSRWFCSREPRRSASEERRHALPRYRSVSQDRLGGSAGAAHRGWPHSASHDTLLQPTREGWAPRARSDHALGRYGRSMEALEPRALLPPHLNRSAWPPERLCRAAGSAGQPVPHGSFAPPSSSSSSSSSREPAPPVQKHPSQPNLQSVDDSGYIGYRSYSPSFQRRTGLLHALSFRDPAFGGLPTFSIAQRAVAPLTDSMVTPLPPLPAGPTAGPAAPREPRPEGGRAAEQPEERREEVVLRQKPPTGRKMPVPLRQMNFVFPEGVKETDICEPSAPGGKGERPVAERPGRRMAPLAAPEDSLASIPFIDEPTSPSIDLKAKHVPASSVVSSAMNSAPAVATSPSSPTFAFALSRHYSQDCSSIKAGRRSSYLLAITTERSKSCDDGLNAFRDEAKILRRMPSRVPSLRMLRSFFTDGSLDSLGTSEDARSKRHSTSDLSDVPFSAVRKEGWLHCKQILTKKGKKVGGGLRQWKRVFAVLRTHSLYLCKDRREAVTCAPAPGEEEPPISIQACLVDISYSETKRKHVFRLTTADFCEYLFQAEDREDMLAWIKVIRENSKAEGEDPGFASQALINKKLNDYRKVSAAGTKPDSSSPKGPRGLGIRAEFLKQTGTSAPRSPRQDATVTKDESSSQKAPWGINIMKKNKKSAPRAFGVRLEECQPAPDNKNVPLIVEACCKVVEDRGLEYMGIYRVPGNNAVVSSLQEQLNKGATEINLQDERWQDLNVISSLLKSFFRKLPEPLFTDDKYNDFIEANRIEDASERMRTLRKLIRDLPGHYYETLKFLVGHLKTIADHSEKNKMEPRNLALVFGPTLVRTSEDNMTDMVTHMPDRYKIVETLIQHSDWFFSDKEDKGEKTPVDEKEAQSVPNIEYLLPNIGRTAAPGDAAGSTRSGSAKPKGTWPSRKAPPHRELLGIPFVSAAARKRKKRREAEGVGSSTDDDAERRDQERQGTAAAPPGPGKAPRGTGTEPAAPGPARAERESSTDPAAGSGSEPAPDARSIVSGYSTLSTMDRSLCSEVQSVAGSRGEEADDERSELSHMETDTESREGARARPGQAGGAGGDEDKGPLGRPSFNSHRLIQCDTLARRKLGRPRPTGEPPELPGEEQGWAPPGRPSLREQLRQHLRGSTDDMGVLGVRLRRAHSPETRRKKSSWRRHTVVVPGGLKDLNFNEWKEPRGLEGSPGPCHDKDSGLSSLESTKARPPAPAPAQPGTAREGTGTKSPPGSPGPPAPLRFPQCL